MKRMGILFAIMVLFLTGCAGKSSEPVAEEKQSSEPMKTTSNNEEVNDKGSNTNEDTVMLNTGIEVKIGEVAELINPLVVRGVIFKGNVISMHPETGTIWKLEEPIGVTEYNYRHVIDIQVTQIIFGNDQGDPPLIEDIEGETIIRGVVTQLDSGEERILFVRQLSGTENSAFSEKKYVIRNMTEYRPSRYYSEEELSGEMLEFYNDNASIS